MLKFCCTGEGLGFNLHSFQDCTTPLVAILRKAVKEKMTSAAIMLEPYQAIPVNQVSVHSPPQEQDLTGLESAAGTAPSGEAELSTNANNVNKNLNAHEESPPPPLQQKLPLEINGVTYIFEYIASSLPEERQAIARQLATSFCQMHGKRLVEEYGALSELEQSDEESLEEFEERRSNTITELLTSQCLAPITGALAVNMNTAQ